MKIKKTQLFSVVLLLLLSVSNQMSYAQCEDFELSFYWEDPWCFEDSTGFIGVSEMTGETGEVDFTISPDFFTISPEGLAEDLPAGDYVITATDELGCSLEYEIVLYQPDSLYFSEFGAEPAFCRTSADQNGHGVVWAAAAGGTPDFEYLWTHLETGESTTNSTWGGRNPGTYQMKVTDDNGCILIKNLTLDSLNPEASFDIWSDDVWEIPYGYAGMAPVNIMCKNTSSNLINWNDPMGDTANFYWHMHNYAEWITAEYNDEPTITYEYENLWGIKLVMESSNGCLDTAHQFIAVFGPLDIENPQASKTVSIIPNQDAQNLLVRSTGFSAGVTIRIYSLSGGLLLDKTIFNEQESIPFNLSKGAYLYEFIDLESNQRLSSGKFVY